MSEKHIIEKTLSPNDLGLTGAHQAGMLIPKDEIILNYFPRLDKTAENPRVALRFLDEGGTPMADIRKRSSLCCADGGFRERCFHCL